jgi:GNAT superfamily N-acetyltransferase
MRHELAPALVSSHAVDAVDYDSVRDLRLAWHYEDFPGSEPGEFIDNQQEIAGRRSARLLAVVERGAPMGFAQLECAQDAAEISEVYVLPEHRGRGIGTSVTLGAIAAAPDVENLWILADDEDRPKELYARLGFRPIWKTMEFLRVPRRLG